MTTRIAPQEDPFNAAKTVLGSANATEPDEFVVRLRRIETHRLAARKALGAMFDAVRAARDDADSLDEGAAWGEMMGAVDAARAIVGREDRAAILLSDADALHHKPKARIGRKPRAKRIRRARAR